MANINLYNQNFYNRTPYNGGAELLQNNIDDNIVFNNFGLQNSKYCTRYIHHEHAPERDLIAPEVPRDDGRNLQDGFWQQKIVSLVGSLIATSNAELLEQIDLMKKFLSVKNGELKIVEGSTTRIYTATWKNPQQLMARDHYNKKYADYNIEFVCFSPFGKDESRTVRTDLNKTSSSIGIELTNAGTTKNRLVTYINIDAADTLTKISFINNTNGKQIDITRVFTAGEIVKIDGENNIIQVDGVDVDFDGYPPTLDIGVNSFTLVSTSTSHSYSITNKFFNYFL